MFVSCRCVLHGHDLSDLFDCSNVTCLIVPLDVWITDGDFIEYM